jgi:hypothetical protein
MVTLSKSCRVDLMYGVDDTVPPKQWPKDGQVIAMLCECLSVINIVTHKENDSLSCLSSDGAKF